MKAVSIMIMTMIIVGIVITVSIGLALWASNIAKLHERDDRLEIKHSYVERFGENYLGYIIVRNSGSMEVSIDSVFINSRVYENYSLEASIENDTVSIGDKPETILLKPSSQTTIYILLPIENYKPGSLIGIKIHTSTGIDYPTILKLP